MNAAHPDERDAAPAAGRDAASLARREALWQTLAARPYAWDLFQALRRLEGAHPELPRFGAAQRPADEPLRFTQDTALNFAPAPIGEVKRDGASARLVQRVFALLGPNGALPIHLTEYARERVLHQSDPTLLRFLDMLLHRFGLLFYRAWAQSQPAVSLDRPDDARIERQLGALFGIGLDGMRGRDALGDPAKLFFAGRLARGVRDADGLRAWIAARFEVPVQVQTCAGHWMTLQEDERSRLTRHGQQGLGRGAVLGRKVWDVQHKFRIVIGPLPLARYREFLPGAPALAALRALVRQYVGFEFEWDLQLVLRAADVPAWSLGRDRAGVAGRLGRSAWANQGRPGHARPRQRDAADLVMNVESLKGAPA